jgi:hypothetical protein
MLTCGTITKYFMKCFRHIIIKTKPSILTNHDDDSWQNINGIKDLWGTNLSRGVNFLGGAKFLRRANFQGGANFLGGTKFLSGENPP